MPPAHNFPKSLIQVQVNLEIAWKKEELLLKSEVAKATHVGHLPVWGHVLCSGPMGTSDSGKEPVSLWWTLHWEIHGMAFEHAVPTPQLNFREHRQRGKHLIPAWRWETLQMNQMV